MKILHLTRHLNTGGITSYLLTLSGEIIRRGHTVVIAAADGDARPRFEAIGVRCELVALKIKSELHPQLYLQLPRLYRIIQDNHIDVIHAHTRTGQVVGAFLSMLTGKPLITTCHGFFKPRWHRRLFGCWGRKVVAISAPVARHLAEDFHLAPCRVALIPNGIDLTFFPAVDDQRRSRAREEWGIKAPCVIGLIARLSSVKGIDVLIDAFALIIKDHPGALLFIVGDGPEAARLSARVDHWGLRDHVRFEKALAQTSSVLPVFDVIVAPSRMEGLGLSVMEAMASGLPVVASRVGGLIDLIEDNHTGYLVVPNDAAQLARVINQALSDKAQAQSIAQNARAHIAESFTSIAMAEQTLDVYQQAVKLFTI